MHGAFFVTGAAILGPILLVRPVWAQGPPSGRRTADSLKITGNRVMLPGGSQDALKALPKFAYATN